MPAKTTGKIRLTNRKRDIVAIRVPVDDNDGKNKYDEFILGSTDDEGEKDSPQPMIEIDGELFDRAMTKCPAFRGMVEARDILADPIL